MIEVWGIVLQNWKTTGRKRGRKSERKEEGKQKRPPPKVTMFEAPSKMGNVILSHSWENEIYEVGLPWLQDWSWMRSFCGLHSKEWHSDYQLTLISGKFQLSSSTKACSKTLKKCNVFLVLQKKTQQAFIKITRLPLLPTQHYFRIKQPALIYFLFQISGLHPCLK